MINILFTGVNTYYYLSGGKYKDIEKFNYNLKIDNVYYSFLLDIYGSLINKDIEKVTYILIK